MINRSYFVAYRHVGESDTATSVTVGSMVCGVKSFLPTNVEDLFEALAASINKKNGWDSVAITSFNRI